MTGRRPQIDARLHDLPRLARLIIAAGFTAAELIAIAETYPGINFREIAQGYDTWPDQVEALLQAAELQNSLDELIRGIIQSKADNPMIQAAILSGIDMQNQNQQPNAPPQSSDYGQMYRVAAMVDNHEQRLSRLERVQEIAEQLKAQTPTVNWTIIIVGFFIAAAIATIVFLFSAGRI